MIEPLRRIQSSPAWVRGLPFVLVALLTMGQGRFGPASAFWLYAAKTFVGALLLWTWRKQITEMRWAFSLESVLVGVGVFVVWVGLDGLYPELAPRDPATAWNPFDAFGEGSALAWGFVGLRMAGSSLMVPALEEVFYRSLLYRWIADPDFMRRPLGEFAWKPFIATSVVFGVAHHEWLAGILCGFAYQWLVCHTRRLGDAMTAHAITNFLLGLWVVWKGAWQFW